jgi:hypothetical protein
LLAKDWNYKYFKIDGLWNGCATRQLYKNIAYRDDFIGETKLSDPEKTHIQALRDGLKVIREGAGNDVYILGCCAQQNMRSFSGAFGLVDAMRIGPDNGFSYPAVLRGPVFGGRSYFLHNRLWHNDPDPLYVRPSLAVNVVRMLCSWVTLSGQLSASSEIYGDLPPDRLELLKRTMPSHTLTPRPADYFSNPCPAVWLLTDDKSKVRRDVVGYFNWGDPKAAEKAKRNKDDDIAVADKRKTKSSPDITVIPHSPDFSYAMDWIGLNADQTYVGYELWTGKFIEPFSGKLDLNVPERDCRIITVRPVSSAPQLLSTSRHITQGIVDVLDESWNEAEKNLQGRSKLVANDAYEMRIAAGQPGKALKCKAVSVSAGDQKAGVTIELVSQDDWKLCILIQSPVSRPVSWTIHFGDNEKGTDPG